MLGASIALGGPRASGQGRQVWRVALEVRQWPTEHPTTVSGWCLEDEQEGEGRDKQLVPWPLAQPSPHRENREISQRESC